MLQEQSSRRTAPRVTIAIPTWRGAATLGAAIESALHQTFDDIEVLVIDDQSPDDTAAVVARFADPRLRHLRNAHNLGAQGNWNRCLDEARGHYIKLLPHDDVLQPTCVARQVAVLEADANERIALVCSARHVLGPRGRVLMRRGLPGAREGVVEAAALMRACVRRGTNLIGEPGGVLFRRALAQHVGPFDGRHAYVIDLDYWFRLLAHGDAWYCDEPLVGFRVSAGQWSVAIGRAQDRDFMGLVAQAERERHIVLSALERGQARAAAWLNRWSRHLFYGLVLRRG